MNVYKVYIHTEEDPHVSEVVVAAESKEHAETRALEHVKKANPHKGERTPQQAKEKTRVLFAKAAGKDGCIVIHRIPLEVFQKAEAVV